MTIEKVMAVGPYVNFYLNAGEVAKFVIDDVNKKTCSVRITPFPIPLVLWSGEDYDAVGDYTQAQLEERVLEVLGNDPASVLKTLVPSNEMIVKSL